MKTKSKWAMNGVAAAGALTLLLTTPMFAQSQGNWNRNDSKPNDSNRNAQLQRSGNDNNRDRDNQRVTMSGKVTSFSRERDGYRVQLDRGRESYWVPQATFGNRARELRSGVSISLGGVFHGGSIYVDAVNWPDHVYEGRYNNNGFVRGVVDRVDYRRGTIWLRDDASGREIVGQTSGRALAGLRRGDYVEMDGRWIRGEFSIARIDNIRGY